MKLFECIIDDGEIVFKTNIAAKSKREMLDKWGGNGNFEKVTDKTNDYFNEDSIERLNDDLMRLHWGDGERKLICALLEEHIRTLKR
ncbi:MAG: hypothetical protein K2N94_05940 [Lachnospiraceae bacterium]|nr:hypothetical protein [Lachnospiraceae bacterium]